MYKNILVAVEESENSYRAVKESIHLVGNTTFVTLLNVKDTTEAQKEVLHDQGPIKHERIEGLENHMDLLEKNNIEHTMKVVSGPIHKTIIEEANSGQYDVVIVGQQGKMLKDIVIGSVSKRVLKESKIPVLLVK